MSETTVVDAHALLWFLEGSPKLSLEAQRRLSDPTGRFLVPAIAVAEACWAINKGATGVTQDELRHALTSDARFTTVPLDLELTFAAANLPGNLEMHDRLIAATTMRAFAVDARITLLTKDAALRNAGVVPTVW